MHKKLHIADNMCKLRGRPAIDLTESGAMPAFAGRGEKLKEMIVEAQPIFRRAAAQTIEDASNLVAKPAYSTTRQTRQIWREEAQLIA